MTEEGDYSKIRVSVATREIDCEKKYEFRRKKIVKRENSWEMGEWRESVVLRSADDAVEQGADKGAEHAAEKPASSTCAVKLGEKDALLCLLQQ